MKKKNIWLVVSSLIVITLLATSCTQAVTDEKGAPSEEEASIPPIVDTGILQEGI